MASNCKEETREAPSDPDEETRQVPWNPEKEPREAPSDLGVETNYVAGLAAGSTDLEGPVVPTRRKITISGNLPPNTVIAHVELAGARRHGSSAAKVSTDERGKRRGECVDVRRRGNDGFAEEGGETGAHSEENVAGEVNWQKTMNALEVEEWRKVRRKKKCKVTRPNDKFMVGAGGGYKRNVKGGEVKKYGCRLVA